MTAAELLGLVGIFGCGILANATNSPALFAAVAVVIVWLIWL